MGFLAQIADAVQGYNRLVEQHVQEVRGDAARGREILDRWRKIRESIPQTVTPTGLQLPRLALPDYDEAGQVARYLGEEGLPGEFPFVASAYREMYLAPDATTNGHPKKDGEEPTRLFAGLGLAEDTTAPFHYLTKHQRSARLSTAFDGPTLYGV